MTRAEGAETGLSASISSTATTTLGTAEAFTTSAVTAGDASTLASANGYTDAETTRAEGQEALKANLAGGNVFTTGKQTLAASTNTYAAMNVPAGAAPAPANLSIGDVFSVSGADSHLQFIDQSSATQELAFLSDVTAASSSVATETARAETAETNLSGLISAETGRAEGVEAGLTSSISTVSSNLASEVTRAEERKRR